MGNAFGKLAHILHGSSDGIDQIEGRSFIAYLDSNSDRQRCADFLSPTIVDTDVGCFPALSHASLGRPNGLPMRVELFHTYVAGAKDSHCHMLGIRHGEAFDEPADHDNHTYFRSARSERSDSS